MKPLSEHIPGYQNRYVVGEGKVRGGGEEFLSLDAQKPSILLNVFPATGQHLPPTKNSWLKMSVMQGGEE